MLVFYRWRVAWWADTRLERWWGDDERGGEDERARRYADCWSYCRLAYALLHSREPSIYRRGSFLVKLWILPREALLAVRILMWLSFALIMQRILLLVQSCIESYCCCQESLLLMSGILLLMLAVRNLYCWCWEPWTETSFIIFFRVWSSLFAYSPIHLNCVGIFRLLCLKAMSHSSFIALWLRLFRICILCDSLPWRLASSHLS